MGGILGTDVLMNEFYDRYKEYCVNNSYRPTSDRKFGKELKTMDIVKIRKMKHGKRQHFYTLSKKTIELKIRKITNNDAFKFDEMENNGIFSITKENEPFDEDDK